MNIIDSISFYYPQCLTSLSWWVLLFW